LGLELSLHSVRTTILLLSRSVIRFTFRHFFWSTDIQNSVKH